MKRKEVNASCECGGELRMIDRMGQSQTLHCQKCNLCVLHVSIEECSLSVLLRHFFWTRLDDDAARPPDELGMAKRLVQALILDVWPSPATVTDYGIESPQHLGALQHAVGKGISAYDLDRTSGDGLAITQLVNGVPGCPYPDVVYKTPWDGLFGNRLECHPPSKS